MGVEGHALPPFPTYYGLTKQPSEVWFNGHTPASYPV